MTPPGIDPKALAYAVASLRLQGAAQRAIAEEEAKALFIEPEVYSLDELLDLKLPPMEWSIEGLHARGMNSLLTAQYKTGKTTLNANLARALATNTDFLGHSTANAPAGNIAFWNYEMGDRMMQQWLEDMKIENPKRIILLNLRGQSIPLYSPYVQEWVTELLAINEVTSWIIDPAIKAMSGWPGVGGENDNGKVSEFLDVLDRIKHDAGVIDLYLSHHTGRASMEEGEERSRGATRWDDWPDVRWILTKKKNKHGDYDRFFYADGRDVIEPESKLQYDKETRLLSIELGASRQASRDMEDALAVVDAVVLIGDDKTKTKVIAAMRNIDGVRRKLAIQKAEDAGLVSILHAAKGTGMLVRLERTHPIVMAHLMENQDIELVEGWDK